MSPSAALLPVQLSNYTLYRFCSAAARLSCQHDCQEVIVLAAACEQQVTEVGSASHDDYILAYIDVENDS